MPDEYFTTPEYRLDAMDRAAAAYAAREAFEDFVLGLPREISEEEAIDLWLAGTHDQLETETEAFA